MQQTTPHQWDKVSKLLHHGFALAVVCQMLLSLIMHRPYIGRSLPFYAAWAFTLHRYIGLLTALLITSYWIWLLLFKRYKLPHLFPWSVAGLRQIKHDLKHLISFQLNKINSNGGLPGLVQGLGLLLMSAVGLLGAILFFTLPETKSMPSLTHDIKELHEVLAYWIWWYLVGHGGMALLHRLTLNRQAAS